MSEDLKHLLINAQNESERKAIREAFEAGQKSANKKPVVNSVFVTSLPKK